MKKLLTTLSGLLLITALQAGNTLKRTPSVDIIPQPARMTVGDKVFTLRAATPICLIAEAPELVYAAELLNRTLAPVLGGELPVSDERRERGILLSLSPAMRPEAYELKVAPRGVTVTAGSPAGAFYACQTLLQLCPAGMTATAGAAAVQIPCVEIEDAPAFDLRGMMFDVARHFFTVSEVKELLDLLAMHKINTFHWHLTDDQGWRIEIKKYPQLTRIGSCRPYTTVKRTLTPDNTPHEGFYTREQIRDIIGYAARRFISVIPEIEIPGHATAALASYPWLGCRGEGYSVWCKWGVSKDVYCAGKESTFEFLEGVLDEVLELFPSAYIHIGGDECPKDNWKSCEHCRKRIENEGLKDENELQSYVMRRIERFVRSRGKKIIGWDEIYDGGLSPTATVMSRYGNRRTGEVIARGNQVVMCPAEHCYFDYYQDDDYDREPIAHRSLLPIEQAYALDPRKDFTPEQLKQILGVECNLWTEYVPDFQHAQYMLLPRLDAFSEAAWSLAPRDYDDFRRRVRTMADRYDARGYRYATHIFREK